MEGFPRHDNEFTQSRQLANTNRPSGLERPSGAFGLRHNSRGLYGFWDAKGAQSFLRGQRRRARPCEVELILDQAQRELEKGNLDRAALILSRI
jgi:hypothetical protein